MLRYPLSFLFYRLNSPSYISFSSHERYSKPLIIFGTLCWSTSSISMSFLGDPELRNPRTGHRISDMVSYLNYLCAETQGLWFNCYDNA